MNHLEMALQSWRQERSSYERSMKSAIAQLTKPIKFLQSPSYEIKQEELREYLRFNYTYDEDQGFNEIYVQHIAGAINMTLMELANKLVEQLGGNIKFWQNKIMDLASNVSYHPELSIWEVNRVFEKHMGLSPEYTSNLRKKKSLTKQYLQKLLGMTRAIDKSKAFQEDLQKLDQLYKKLKKAQEKYYAFLEEVNDMVTSKEVSNISLKGKKEAKNSLFMFLKPKEEKINTLAKYNFQIQNNKNSQKQSKLLKGTEYTEFDEIFKRLSEITKSQRQSVFSDYSNCYGQTKSEKNDDKLVPIDELRTQFNQFSHKKSKNLSSCLGSQLFESEKKTSYTFIWRKQYYFTFWGFPIQVPEKIDYLNQIEEFEQINYDLRSQDEYDELNAEDVNSDFDSSSAQSLSNNSFVVDDDFVEDGENQNDLLYRYKPNIGFQRWEKEAPQLEKYQIICLWDQPMNYVVTEEALGPEFVEKLEGKGKAEILNLFQEEKKSYSKTSIDSFLRDNFHRMRSKQGRIIYRSINGTKPVEKCENNSETNQMQVLSEQQTTYEIVQNSVSATRAYQLRSSVRVENKIKSVSQEEKPIKDLNETILEQRVET